MRLNKKNVESIIFFIWNQFLDVYCADQVEESKNAKDSKVVTIPVQHEKSPSRTIPVQRLSPSRVESNGIADQPDSKELALLRLEKSALEETTSAKMKVMEERLSVVQDQLKSLQKENETLAKQSQKTLSDLKSCREKELVCWEKEKEDLKKTNKLVCW